MSLQFLQFYIKGPLLRPQKFPDIPVSLEENTEVPGTTSSENSPLLIATGGSIPLLCLEGVPDLPGAHQDEASLTTKFET